MSDGTAQAAGEGMSEADVPDELVAAAGDVLEQNGLWGAWEREQTEEESRTILAAVLPLHQAALLAEVKRLRGELAEERADRNPLLRCLLIKAAPDRDLYVGWSNIVEAPTGVWTRAEAIAYGFPPSRLDRADKNGSSSRVRGYGQWDDEGFIAEQRGWLRRDRLGDYALAYARDDLNAAFDLLEPFEDETEVRRD